MAPQTWLITGCSSGFGAEFVHQLRALGDNVIATGRHAETKLAHLKDTGASIIDLDVTAPEEVIATKIDEAWGIYPGGIDVVVNNAGYILSAAFEELTYAQTLSSPCFFADIRLQAKGSGRRLQDQFPRSTQHNPRDSAKATSQGDRNSTLHGLSGRMAVCLISVLFFMKDGVIY